MKAATILAAPAQTDGVPAGGYRPVRFPARAWADALHRAWRLVRGGRGVSQRREEFPAGRPPSAPGSPAVRADLDGPDLDMPGTDRPGIDELYSHRRLDLVRLALLLVDDLPTAEDVVQDVFAALCRRHGERPAWTTPTPICVRAWSTPRARSCAAAARYGPTSPNDRDTPRRPRNPCCCARSTEK